MTTPEWWVERLAAGDLPPEQAQRIRDALAREGGLDRLEAIAASDRELAARYPAPPGLARRAAPVARPRLTPLWLPAIALAAAAALVLSLSPTGAPELTPDTERLKGLAPRLVVHRRAGARVESLDAQSRLRAGDTLQLGYVAAGRRFVAIVSLDGRGALTQHWPRDGVDAVESAGPQEIVLPDAYRLDDAPGFERFVLLSSDAPFSLRALTATPWSPEAARRAALPLPPSVEQTSLLLEKESP